MKNATFSRLYTDLPRTNNVHKRVRNSILERCQVSYNRFYNWTQGISRVPKQFHATIADVFGKPVSEVFPPDECTDYKIR